ncbi:MAG: hypothetical protein WCV84_03975, partial [Patescibacteria group bacterium]
MSTPVEKILVVGGIVSAVVALTVCTVGSNLVERWLQHQGRISSEQTQTVRRTQIVTDAPHETFDTYVITIQYANGFTPADGYNNLELEVLDYETLYPPSPREWRCSHERDHLTGLPANMVCGDGHCICTMRVPSGYPVNFGLNAWGAERPEVPRYFFGNACVYLKNAGHFVLHPAFLFTAHRNGNPVAL